MLMIDIKPVSCQKIYKHTAGKRR